MYRKKPKGWLKHWDFILLEIICLQISYVVAYFIRHREIAFWHSDTYLAVAFFLLIDELVITYFSETFKNVLKRGLYNELTATIKHTMLII
ncbi:MAG: sugar transferase, partial [Lachnospiraceae bacterium]|nr:sugar transferase [Lachnospiraceae bacterium]MBR6382817.1 sugar transferase [Lachnospiraceae bacterium]